VHCDTILPISLLYIRSRSFNRRHRKEPFARTVSCSPNRGAWPRTRSCTGSSGVQWTQPIRQQPIANGHGPRGVNRASLQSVHGNAHPASRVLAATRELVAMLSPAWPSAAARTKLWGRKNAFAMSVGTMALPITAAIR